MMKNLYLIVCALAVTLAYALPSEDAVKGLMRQGNFAVAEDQIKQLVNAEPNNAKYLYWLSQSEERNKELPQALVHIRHALTIDPSISFGRPEVVTAMVSRLDRLQNHTYARAELSQQVARTDQRRLESQPAHSEDNSWIWRSAVAVFFILCMIVGSILLIKWWVTRTKAIKERAKFMKAKTDILTVFLNTRKKAEDALAMYRLSTNEGDKTRVDQVSDVLTSYIYPGINNLQKFEYKPGAYSDLSIHERNANNVVSLLLKAQTVKVDATPLKGSLGDKSDSFQQIFGKVFENDRQPAANTKTTTYADSSPRRAHRSAGYAPPPSPPVVNHHDTTTVVVAGQQNSVVDDIIRLDMAESLLEQTRPEVVNNYYERPRVDVDYTPAPTPSYDSSPSLDIDSGSGSGFDFDSGPSLDLD